MTSNADIERMNEFYSLYGQGKSWDDIGPTFASFYDDDVIYDMGVEDHKVLGYEQLVNLGKRAIDANATFKVDKIEERDDGIYSSGWLIFPGVTDGEQYAQSISKMKDGKFVYIKNVHQPNEKLMSKLSI